MKIEKSRVFTGTICKSLSPYGPASKLDDDYNNFGMIVVKEKAFLIKFGDTDYVPIQAIKNPIHFSLLESKVRSDGFVKYSKEFISESSNMMTPYFVKDITSAFSPKSADEIISISHLKKFAKTLEKNPVETEKTKNH